MRGKRLSPLGPRDRTMQPWSQLPRPVQTYPIALEFALQHLPQRIARALTTDGFDPRVLAGRHCLLGKLFANPIGFPGHEHTAATSRYGQRGGAFTKSAADDHEVGCEFVGVGCVHAVT